MSEWVVMAKIDGIGTRYIRRDGWRNERLLVTDLADATRMSRSLALETASELDDAIPIEVDS